MPVPPPSALPDGSQSDSATDFMSWPVPAALAPAATASLTEPVSAAGLPATPETARTAPPVAASFIRISLAVYALLIVYASWFPFSGWRDIGLSPLAYLTAKLPYYWTLFDVLTNVGGYAPLGLLCMYALYPRVRGVWAILLTFAAGALLSGVMEAVQTWLPTRVASNLDLLTNSGGVLLGAVVGALTSHALLDSHHLLTLRRRWFQRGAGTGLGIVALWPLALIYPQSQMFGLGQVVSVLSGWLSSLLNQPVDLTMFWMGGVDLSAEQYWLTDIIVTACGMVGGVLTFLLLLRKSAPRGWLAAALLAAVIVTKALTSALFFTPEQAFAWLTPGATGGILMATLMLFALAMAPPAAQRRVAALALLISLTAANLLPDNPYFAATLQTWAQGKFLNFNGVAQCLSVLWPFLALWFLLRPARRVAAAARV